VIISQSSEVKSKYKGADMFEDFFFALAKYARGHLSEVCFGITAVTMVLVGPYVNGVLKKLTAKLHWFLRYLLYIFLCTAGFGFLSHVIYSGVRHWFIGLSNPLLLVWTAGIYLLLAWLALQQKEI
jgi:hypothetical protein